MLRLIHAEILHFKGVLGNFWIDFSQAAIDCNLITLDVFDSGLILGSCSVIRSLRCLVDLPYFTPCFEFFVQVCSQQMLEGQVNISFRSNHFNYVCFLGQLSSCGFHGQLMSIFMAACQFLRQNASQDFFYTVT